MRTLEATLEELVFPITWLEGPGRWPADWDAITRSPLVSRQRVDALPTAPWDWRCSDAAVRAVSKDGAGTVWFWGDPQGQERDALLDILLMAGRGHSRLSRDSETRLAALTQGTQIAVLTTPG